MIKQCYVLLLYVSALWYQKKGESAKFREVMDSCGVPFGRIATVRTVEFYREERGRAAVTPLGSLVSCVPWSDTVCLYLPLVFPSSSTRGVEEGGVGTKRHRTPEEL